MRHLLITILLGNCFYFISLAQIKDIVATDGITSPLHKANTGKITFMNGNIPIEQYKESDFLTVFELKAAADLNIRVFMSNSITNYLHLLAPDLTAEELIVKGNYQFSFFVDGNFIYKENLHYGAGLKKNTTTTFRVPLTTSKGEDWWGVYMMERFMLNGGEKVLTDGMHNFKIEMRPYLKIDETGNIKVGDIIAEGQLKLRIKTPKITTKQIAVQPIKPNSG